MSGSSEKKCVTHTHSLIDKYIWTAKRHRNVIERRLTDTGVYRRQHQILMFLSDNPNISQKELADSQKISTATVAVSLKKLEKGGYIRREVDEKDNRYNQICITEKGKRVIEESAEIFREVEDAMLEGFSADECRVLEDFINRMYANLSAYAPDVCRKEHCHQERKLQEEGQN